MKNKKTIKRMLKKNNKAPPPAPMKTDNSPSPAPAGGLFAVLSQTLGQGVAFGAGSSIGHKAVDAVTGSTTSSSNNPKSSFNCDDVKKTYELCLETNGFCDQVRKDYIECLEKFYLLNK